MGKSLYPLKHYRNATNTDYSTLHNLKIQMRPGGEDNPKRLPSACGSGQSWKNLFPQGKQPICERHRKKASGEKAAWGNSTSGFPVSVLWCGVAVCHGPALSLGTLG